MIYTGPRERPRIVSLWINFVLNGSKEIGGREKGNRAWRDTFHGENWLARPLWHFTPGNEIFRDFLSFFFPFNGNFREISHHFFPFFFLANILGISRGNTRARRFLFIYFFFLACWETIFCNRELLSSAPSEREHDCTKIDRIRVDRISFV